MRPSQFLWMRSADRPLQKAPCISGPEPFRRTDSDGVKPFRPRSYAAGGRRWAQATKSRRLLAEAVARGSKVAPQRKGITRALSKVSKRSRKGLRAVSIVGTLKGNKKLISKPVQIVSILKAPIKVLKGPSAYVG